MKNDLIKIILSKKLPVVILSPHEDDAILSCGDLITQLNGKTSITIINIFTKAHKPPYTLSAKKTLQNAGFTNAEDLYEARRVEDQKAFSTLDVRVVNLGLEDALFRRKKKISFFGRLFAEFDHYYPTYPWHIIKKIAVNDSVVADLQEKLKQYNNKKNLVFAPFAIGNHADHRIARLVCERVFDLYVLYSDFPYNVRLDSFGEALSGGQTFRLDPNLEKKADLIKLYKTQFLSLFNDGIIPNHQEIYFSNKPL